MIVSRLQVRHDTASDLAPSRRILPSVIGSICSFEDGLADIMTGVRCDRPARRCDVQVRSDQAASAAGKAEYLMRWGGQCSARCTPQQSAAARETLSQFRPQARMKARRKWLLFSTVNPPSA